MISNTAFYLHAEGLLHFNRGALKEAEAVLRKAIEADTNLGDYLALFATFRRTNQQAKIEPILRSLDLSVLKGTPGQKMFLAQELRAAGQSGEAISYAYDVLRQAPNDPEAALRYFGLLMFGPAERMIPPMHTVGFGAWVRLEGRNGEGFTFIIEHGQDRPTSGLLSPTHPVAAAAIGLAVGQSFTLESPFGNSSTWRIAEIKHKYLHALHDAMEHFQTRFADAQGLYRITVRDGDIQPALEEVKKVSETNRRFADLYFIQHIPIAMLAARSGRDSIGFAEYIRSLGGSIDVCLGNEPERSAALDVISQAGMRGAVLDTYTAWTAATIDVLDVLTLVFGKLLLPQSSMDELRILRDKDEPHSERAIMVGWRDGEFFKQEYTKEDIESRTRFIDEQIRKIEQNFEIRPAMAPDHPREISTILIDTFGTYVLDAAHLAAEGHVLLSEDMHFRHVAQAAASVNCVWLQLVLTFARDSNLLSRERYSDCVASWV